MDAPNHKNIGKNKKATISDVAKAAGVAPSTVSHVLNGTACVTEGTAQRVRTAIEKLNYSPNALARALRQEKTRLIGVVLQDISSEFYARCAASILEAAREDRYVVLICDALFDNAIIDESVHALIERRVEGFIFIGGGNDEHILEYIQNSNIPIVLGDRHHEELPSVEFDNKSTVKNMVCALYEAGYRRFAYVGEPLSVQNNLVRRSEGFLAGLKECKIHKKDAKTILDESLHLSKISTAYTVFNRHFAKLSAQERPEVILTSNDMIAHGIISAAKHMQLRVPEDIAVVGFDDISISKYFDPALTTIAQDEKQLGSSCYQMLKSVMKGKKRTAHDVLPQKIIVRESAVISQEILYKYSD